MTTAVFIYKEDLLKALQLIQDAMQKEFLYRPMTEATKERMRRRLDEMLRHHGAGENNPIWRLKYEIIQTGLGSFELRPDLEGVTLLSRKNPLEKP